MKTYLIGGPSPFPLITNFLQFAISKAPTPTVRPALKEEKTNASNNR